MPLIIMTGFPSSGKTTRCKEIKKYFEDTCNKKVHVVSEEDFYQQSNTDKNKLAFDSKKQKEIRANLKANVTRLLSSDVVILDASNNIKGYRYELYCATKCHKTTQCIVLCDIRDSKARELNESRKEEDRYSNEAFDALVALNEPVNSDNRWDKPLIRVAFDEELPGKDIYDASYNQISPKPNQSTQNVPLCPSTYLSDLDKVTKDVINAILQLQSDGMYGRNVKLPNVDVELALLDDRINARKLAIFKQQFISFCKLNPPSDSQNNIAKLFVQFINSKQARLLIRDFQDRHIHNYFEIYAPVAGLIKIWIIAIILPENSVWSENTNKLSETLVSEIQESNVE